MSSKLRSAVFKNAELRLELAAQETQRAALDVMEAVTSACRTRGISETEDDDLQRELRIAKGLLDVMEDLRERLRDVRALVRKTERDVIDPPSAGDEAVADAVRAGFANAWQCTARKDN